MIAMVRDSGNRDCGIGGGGNSNGTQETIGVGVGVLESTCQVSRSVF